MINWLQIYGNHPVLLVASHNLPHIRENRLKPADMGTGEIARLLANKLGVNALISKSVQKDPNWYINSSFRKKVKEIIKKKRIITVIDIHGRKKGSPNLLEFLPNQNFTNKYNNLLKNKFIRPFKEDDQTTLSEDLESVNIPCVEIEVRKDGREGNTKEYKKVVKELTEMISTLVQVKN
jgi:hypothetical protein